MSKPLDAAYSAETEIEEKPQIKEQKNYLAVQILILGIVFAISFIANPWQETASGSMLLSEEILSVVNQDRAEFELPPLQNNKLLEAAAYQKALDILEKDYFAHTSPSGKEPWEFIRENGFTYSYAGENLAMNYLDAQELQEDFLASPNHRDNLLSPLFSEVGIATVRGEYEGADAIITVQMFGHPSEAVAVK